MLQWRPAIEFMHMEMGASDVDGYEGQPSDYADRADVKEASLDKDQSLSIVEVSCHHNSTSEPVMLMGMSVTILSMRMQIRSLDHRMWMMDQPRMWRTNDIVLQSVKIGQYDSDQ